MSEQLSEEQKTLLLLNGHIQNSLTTGFASVSTHALNVIKSRYSKLIREKDDGVNVVYDRLNEVKRQHEFGHLHQRDTDWLIEQAEKLRTISNRWIEIETNGTPEEASDFYTFVQDTLTTQP